MKRDIELFRKILLKTEELHPSELLSFPEKTDDRSLLEIESYDDPWIIVEHIKLLKDGGYIEAKIIVRRLANVPDFCKIIRLLNDGHDFLANAKNPTIWKKTTDFLASKGGDVSLAVLKGILTKMASEYLGLS